MRRGNLGTAKSKLQHMSMVAVTLVVSLFVLVGSACAVSPVDPNAVISIPSHSQITEINKQANAHRLKADYWGHKIRLHVPRAHTVIPESKSVEYEKYRRDRWKQTADKYRKRYAQEQAKLRLYARANRDIHLALQLASRQWGVSPSWLHACNHSEGGHGWVMNKGGSGAGGPMQFMRGTFYGYSGPATRMLPRQYNNWYSHLGQAYTAAYMFSIGQSGQWTGHGC